MIDLLQHTPILLHHTKKTAPMRKGIDPHTYEVDVRPAVEHLDFARMLDSARYPWHLVPKGDSANVIARAKFNFATTTISTGQYMDVLVLNVAETNGSQTTAPAATPGPVSKTCRNNSKFSRWWFNRIWCWKS